MHVDDTPYPSLPAFCPYCYLIGLHEKHTHTDLDNLWVAACIILYLHLYPDATRENI